MAPKIVSQNQNTLNDDLDEFTKLSLRTRLIGFTSCVLLGSFFSALAYSAITVGRTRSFAILYGITNIIFISGTSFIVGPIRQFKLMFTPERLMSSLIYLAATTAVILTALKGKMMLAMVLFFIQILSLIWYTISYLPFAQGLVTKIFGF